MEMNGEMQTETGGNAFRKAAGWLDDILIGQKDRFILWVPVFLAAGIGVYFGYAREPSAAFSAMLCVASCSSFFAARRLRHHWQ
ncbi:MAG TPA: hypothetical protein VIG74_05750, partial [Alphaproteobacteria bacterium]